MTDTPWVEIRVDVKKTASDGNYGGETAQVTLTEWVHWDTPQNHRENVAALLLMQARGLVHDELMRSPSSKVRAAVQQQPARPTAVTLPPEYGDDDDGDPF